MISDTVPTQFMILMERFGDQALEENLIRLKMILTTIADWCGMELRTLVLRMLEDNTKPMRVMPRDAFSVLRRRKNAMHCHST